MGEQYTMTALLNHFFTRSNYSWQGDWCSVRWRKALGGKIEFMVVGAAALE